MYDSRNSLQRKLLKTCNISWPVYMHKPYQHKCLDHGCIVILVQTSHPHSLEGLALVVVLTFLLSDNFLAC